MNSRNLHKALKTEIVNESDSREARFVLVKLQHSKEDVTHSLHVEPHSFSTAGVQYPDFLAWLGFQRSPCAFVNRHQCYVREVQQNLDLEKFSATLSNSFNSLRGAQKHLEKCGYFFNRPEGWGYYFGRSSAGRQSTSRQMWGDGHTAAETKVMKETEDEAFFFKFTWIKNNERNKGWVIHYKPKHEPPSEEIKSAFGFLEVSQFSECPHFDFEQCFWKSIAYQDRGNHFFDSNAQTAHSWFDSHEEHFSSGIQKLLKANSLVEKFDLRLLPFDNALTRLEKDLQEQTSEQNRKKESAQFDYDIALSFAGPERNYAEKLAGLLKESGISVFCDNFYQDYLWGKDLVTTFDEIYRKRSRFCVIFISEEYNQRMWTIHERRSALARALEEKGDEYILPVKVEDVELEGLQPTVGYQSIDKGAEHLAQLLIKKLDGNKN